MKGELEMWGRLSSEPQGDVPIQQVLGLQRQGGWGSLPLVGSQRGEGSGSGSGAGL